ncbi:hypothetical protein B5F73_05595 [Olsenella sp. An270]|nr:hypothetical protein B5F73_05595 [Olsenella sp. An270]
MGAAVVASLFDGISTGAMEPEDVHREFRRPGEETSPQVTLFIAMLFQELMKLLFPLSNRSARLLEMLRAGCRRLGIPTEGCFGWGKWGFVLRRE